LAVGNRITPAQTSTWLSASTSSLTTSSINLYYA
jgi:hypothetical protein